MKRQTHMKSVHLKRRNETKNAVSSSLKAMIEEEIPISFASVSRMSGVSVGSLYYHDDIRKEIADARDAYRCASSRRSSTAGVGTAKEMRREIRTLQKRIEELEEEVRMNEIFLEPSWTHGYFDDE